MKKGIIIAILLLLAGFGVYQALQKLNLRQEHKTYQESQVLLEQVRQVCKLITVEGQFSEIYDYKDYWGYDIGLFRKKALVRVKAKVSVGYDLGQMQVTAHPEEKIIEVSAIPDPEILSIDHDLDYYDISEGTFNSFSKEDYNLINTAAKAKIREQAENSDLMLNAEKQADQILSMLELMVESAGWELRYKNSSNAPEIEDLLK